MSLTEVFQPQLQEITCVHMLKGWQDLVEVHTLPISKGASLRAENVILFDCGSVSENVSTTTSSFSNVSKKLSF